MADDQEKTEEPTGHKLDEAREKGDVPNSKDFGTLLVFVGFSLAIYFFGGFLLKHCINLFHIYFDFQRMNLSSTQEFIEVCKGILKEILIMTAPIFISVSLFAVAASLGQFGLLFSLDKITPNFGKLDPLSGIKRWFSKDGMIELAKATAKITAVSFLMYLTLRGETGRLLELGTWPLGQIFVYFFTLLTKVWFVILLFLAILGIFDMLYQRWSWHNRMKMSMQEVRDESKNREGDGQVKARIRQIGRDRLRKKMMEKVPEADVVVTNPTHVAVALKYDRGKMRAPVVVAKGAGVIALRIKEIAITAGVPVMEKRDLARFLYRNVEVGETIPESLYSAIAEVLAYVYKVKKKFTAVLKSNAQLNTGGASA